jgi:hypothetical protein
MADNRLYLVHKHSGKAIMLGKRLTGGYYKPPSEDRLQAFYDGLETEMYPDDFMVVTELDDVDISTLEIIP